MTQNDFGANVLLPKELELGKENLNNRLRIH